MRAPIAVEAAPIEVLIMAKSTRPPSSSSLDAPIARPMEPAVIPKMAYSLAPGRPILQVRLSAIEAPPTPAPEHRAYGVARLYLLIPLNR